MEPSRGPMWGPRAPSRFIRGRARGGGAYRPYFYFRRNGRTIPGHGRGGGRGRGCPGGIPTTTGPRISAGNDSPSSSFLRPAIYAAPEDIQQQIQCIAIETPLQCPGWRLYFLQEPYETASGISKRLEAVEKHYSNHPANYDLLKIQGEATFVLNAKVITRDETLTAAWPQMIDDLRMNPQRNLAIFAAGMHSLVTAAALDASLSQPECSKNYFSSRTVRPRKIYARPVNFMGVGLMSDISNAALDQMYCVRGVVVSVGSVETAASWIAYKCSRCGQEQALRQTACGGQSRPFACKRDGCLAKQGFVELRSSPFTRIAAVQVIRLAETQLNTLLNFEFETPSYLDVELRHDLVDSVVPGQEVEITGTLKIRSLEEEQDYQRPQGFRGQMQIFLKAASIVDAVYTNHTFTERDMEAITEINGEPDSFKLLVHSLAPEVHGHELAKAGVLLSLFGGAGSQTSDEAEINVLLVGDPGVGKSNIMEMCAKISEKGSLIRAKRNTGSAGNKLTVSIHGRGRHTIDSGGLVAARNGHCSIDDIDRLASQQDVLMQVMQSQLVSLPFPSLFGTFGTPISVIATANSIRGHYDHAKLLTENIRISYALLSEFHLIFVLLDKPDKEMDTSLTEHVRALHAGAKKTTAIARRFAQKPKTNNSINMSVNESEEPENEDDYDLEARLKLNPVEEAELDLLPALLMKKFVAYARQQVKPLLVEEAAEALKRFYMELREERSDDKTYSISTSHLLGLIRLAQARARIDLSSEVTKAHVRDVICIVRQSNDDIALGDHVPGNAGNAATAGSSQNVGGNVKKFIQMLQMRSSALARRIFDFDELKDMARRVGISCGVTNLIDVVNLQGILLKKGPDMYEVMLD